MGTFEELTSIVAKHFRKDSDIRIARADRFSLRLEFIVVFTRPSSEFGKKKEKKESTLQLISDIRKDNVGTVSRRWSKCQAVLVCLTVATTLSKRWVWVSSLIWCPPSIR